MELNIIEMSLITISAIVKADGSFVFPPFGLPGKKTISVNQVTTVTGVYQVSSNCGGRHCGHLIIFVR